MKKIEGKRAKRIRVEHEISGCSHYWYSSVLNWAILFIVNEEKRWGSFKQGRGRRKEMYEKTHTK
jgi:hypothetical protein